MSTANGYVALLQLIRQARLLIYAQCIPIVKQSEKAKVTEEKLFFVKQIQHEKKTQILLG